MAETSLEAAVEERMIIRADCRLEAGWVLAHSSGVGGRMVEQFESMRGRCLPGKSGVDGVPSRLGGREKGAEEEEHGDRGAGN